MTEAPPLPSLHAWDDALEAYVRSVSALPLLEAFEAQALVGRIRAGDAGALDALVGGHLRYVVDEAVRLRGGGTSLGHLIEAGNGGLREAALRWEPDEGRSFLDYAKAWIRSEMREHLDRR